MSKPKVHLASKPEILIGDGKHGPYGLCKAMWIAVTEDPRKVTCKNCLRLMASNTAAKE